VLNRERETTDGQAEENGLRCLGEQYLCLVMAVGPSQERRQREKR